MKKFIIKNSFILMMILINNNLLNKKDIYFLKLKKKKNKKPFQDGVTINLNLIIKNNKKAIFFFYPKVKEFLIKIQSINLNNLKFKNYNNKHKI